jgi:leukotriene-A4 hydrolase
MSDEGISINLILNPEDISSYSNFDKILQKEMEIFATLDFEKKIFSGYIITTYLYLDKTINYLILDLKGPEIEKIEYLQNNNVYPLNFQIHNENENKNILGTPLIINLPIFPENEIPDELRIKIFFSTNQNCSGIFFLEKEQTESKNYYFMFTKCKSIECRSLFPCQDTPFAKVIIEANLEIESPYKFLFSGIQKGFFYNSNTKKIIFFIDNIFQFQLI